MKAHDRHNPQRKDPETAPFSFVQLIADARIKKDAQLQRRFLMLAEVERITRRKKSSIYAGMADGTFPRCVKLPGTRSVAWLSTDVNVWMDAVLNANGHLPFGDTAEGAAQ